MKKLHTVLALAIFSSSLSGGVALAQDHHDNRPDAEHRDQDHHDNHYVEHKEWKRNARMRHEDWDRGERFDYHQHHLNPPPRGYEWRMVDGHYILANSSNFQIRTIIRIP